MLEFATRLEDGPVARLHDEAGLSDAVAAIVRGDESDDAAGLGHLVGQGNGRLDPVSRLHLGVHCHPLFLSGTVDANAVLDDEVVVAVEDLHLTPFGLNEGGQAVVSVCYRNRNERRLLQLWPRVDPRCLCPVEMDFGHSGFHVAALFRLTLWTLVG